MLEQRCNHSKQYCNNVATLCCAKNRRCESSRVTSPLGYVVTELFVNNFHWRVQHMPCGTKLNSNKNAKSDPTLTPDSLDYRYFLDRSLMVNAFIFFTHFLAAYVRTSLIYTPSTRQCKGNELGQQGKCMCQGGNLAVINDTEKLNFIQDKLKRLNTFSGKEFWTGVRWEK